MSRSPWDIPAWVWGVALAANVVAWGIMRVTGFSGADRVQCLALIDTLVAVVWYAVLTRRLLKTGQDQLKASRVAVAVIQRRNEGDASIYGFGNIGPGFAVRVLYSELPAGADNGWIPRPNDWEPQTAIGAGGVARFAIEIENRLRSHAGSVVNERPRVVLATETLDGDWWISVTVVGPRHGLDTSVRRATAAECRALREVAAPPSASVV
jgi:hypothetical protein